MKFKVKNPTNNIILMTFLLVLLFITCIFWLILKKYTYFIIYLIITILICIIYYINSYKIDNNYLIIYMGFIKIKLNIKNIKEITNTKNNEVKITFNKLSIKLYPVNSDLFITCLKEKNKLIKVVK